MFVKIIGGYLQISRLHLPLLSNQLKNYNMKKLFYLFVAATLTAGVVSCSQKAEEAPAEEVAVEETAVEEAPVEAAPVDSAAAAAAAAPAAEAAPAAPAAK
jgi:hypothetical protein